ncbi:MAG: MaoC family dehydratase [Lautropia sp.]
MSTTTKHWGGRFFEDFSVGQRIRHAGALTVTESMATQYRCLTGTRHAVQCSEPFARSIGFRTCPLDDVLVFKILFGHSVRDISMRAVATLGYGECVFREPVYPGDTLQSETVITALGPGPSAQTGLVHVRTTGTNQAGRVVAAFTRWLSVRRREPAADLAVDTGPAPVLASAAPAELYLPADWTVADFDVTVTGSPFLWDDYQVGERIDHVDGCTIEEFEATAAARLYQNVAPPHYNAHFMASTDFGRRIVFVGHLVGLVRALSYNGLSNVFRVAAIDSTRHFRATFAGATVYAWTEVRERLELPGRTDIGALRLRSIATKDLPCDGFPGAGTPDPNDPSLLLAWDYVGLIPRRQS